MTNSRFTCFMIGAGVGAGVSLLLAPASGRTTRRAIAKRTNAAKRLVQRSGAQVQTSVTDVVDFGRSGVKRANQALNAVLAAANGR